MKRKAVVILMLTMLAICQVSVAQGFVRIWPKQSGDYQMYEGLVPHNEDDFLTHLQTLLESVPNKESCNYCVTFNWGDDEIMNAGQGDGHLTYAMDRGDYNNWYNNSQTFLQNYRGSLEKAWFCINLTNICLARVDSLAGCQPELKNEILGSLYFMRAWWHQELMTYYGPMPYVDYELVYDDVVKLPRPTAKECAERCAEDFARAAELLPLEETNNIYYSGKKLSQKPNRLAALAYKGKVLLWAASPLNYMGAQTGAIANGNTYRYENTLAKQAAEALGTTITVANGSNSPFKLAAFASGYSHKMDILSIYEQNFEGLTDHPFTKKGYEQYDADGLFVHNDISLDNSAVQYIVGKTRIISSSYKYMLRVTLKGPKKGSLDCIIGSASSTTVSCTVPFTSDWQTVDCIVSDYKKAFNSYIRFLSGETVGDIHIKDVQLITYSEEIEEVANPYCDLFYTMSKSWETPGLDEVLFTNWTNINESNWNFSKTWGPKISGLVAHDNIIHMPTANYVNYAYGMANGLPITDHESGFDPSYPFRNRDPRFYNDIVYDGYKYVENPEGLYTDQKELQYMHLYTGGNARDEEYGSRTGYFCKKLVPTECNEGDRAYDYGKTLQCNLSYMRLADVYLMYAEACAAYGSASTSNNCTLTAVDAINVLRDRVGAGHVAGKFTADKRLFMDEVRRERACELAFEGQRWSDLARWLLLTEAPYNKKTSQEFTRIGTFNEKEQEPIYNMVAGWTEKEILTRNLNETHYVFPLNPDTPPEIDTIYSADKKTLIYYPKLSKNDTFVVPEHVEILGENCFSYNGYLKNIVLHDGIKEIRTSAFAGTGITEMKLPKLITSLPDNCYAGTPLRSITIPSRITSVGDGCFSYCRDLETVVIEDGVQSLGDACFAACEKIKEFNIPASVNHIGKACFAQGGTWHFGSLSIGSLERINVDKGNTAFTIYNNVLYDKAMTRLIACPSLYRGELTVPEGVTIIDSLAIYCSPYITKVTLPSSLETVVIYNFNSCMKLTDVVLNAVEPPYWVLYTSNFFSTGLTLHVPAQSVETYKQAYRSPYIQQILPIGAEQQYEPNDLVLISGGYNTYEVGLEGLTQNLINSIQKIYVNGEEKSINDVLRKNNNDEDIISVFKENENPSVELVMRMDDQFTEIDNLIFNANKVILPQTVKKLTIDNDFRLSNNRMNHIVLPEGLEEIGEKSLYGFGGSTITIPKSVKSIGDGSFEKNLLIEFGVDSENQYYTSIDGVLYDKSVKTLVAYPFLKPEKDYTVPSTVETIKANIVTEPGMYGNNCAFQRGALTLPAGLKAIGEQAFYSFMPASVVCHAKTVPQLGSNAFDYDQVLFYSTTLYVPWESVDAYKADKQWNNFFKILPIGDANGDGILTREDADAIVDYYLGIPSYGFNAKAADVNNDGKVTISDANEILNIIMK